MTTVVIAEKPSMARAIREGLGPQANRYEITNAFGHILEQAEPDAYLPGDVPKTAKGKKIWRMQDLPILPAEWKKFPKRDAKDQLAKIGALLKSADTVINAGDPDREGQLLIDEILEHFHYRGKVLRVWLKALDAENVRKAFAALESNEKYRPLKDAAEARSQSDWVVGMNLTRAVTVKSGDLFSIGRVQTPTLAIVVRRDLEIENFVPKDYFEVFAQCRHAQGAFLAKWEPSSTDGPGFDEEGRLIDKRLAVAVAQKAKGAGKVARFEAKEQKQSAPLPYSLSALQKVASSRFGMSAQQVLDTCQSLYEKKITSYPRTDCRYLPEEQLVDAPRILGKLPIPDGIRPLLNPRQKHTAWNNVKITAHNAIVPTGEPARGLSDAEAKLYDLIWRSYVALFLPDYRYRALSATIALGGESWKATGRQDIDLGWKKLFGAQALEDDEDADGGKAPLPVMQTGDPVQGDGGKVVARQTKPPARFTDGSLIDAMSNIHKFVTDPQAKAKLKETSGLGTEATRASVLETLLQREYLQKKGKQLISTPKGRALIAYLEKQRLGSFADPVTTARWEDVLGMVAEGKVPMQKFTAAVTQEVAKAIEVLKSGSAMAGGGSSSQQPLRAQPCPICGGDAVVRRLQSKKNRKVFFWSCSNRDAHPLLQDDNGKPGKPFEERKEDSGPPGPACPHCAGTATRTKTTSTGKTYYRCPSCQAAFWPDREDPQRLGAPWLPAESGGRRGSSTKSYSGAKRSSGGATSAPRARSGAGGKKSASSGTKGGKGRKAG
ncbi:DNA topoisomerase 3 [Acidithiobacillus caldus]|uniref:DNA topoisomerase 3 n=1 Tax=Acidithiobacillus caldus TaxID=33059 RepID=UPI001C0721CE|nr:DNA topoisomerase 3 [Acidithiobacillus caldus]MBU2762462.1 DNA topoisomerase III [Acidithiobacillus caldus]MBU2771502.1 DNA topoisomerase III [Acidithiobacillus caldus]